MPSLPTWVPALKRKATRATIVTRDELENTSPSLSKAPTLHGDAQPRKRRSMVKVPWKRDRSTNALEASRTENLQEHLEVAKNEPNITGDELPQTTEPAPIEYHMPEEQQVQMVAQSEDEEREGAMQDEMFLQPARTAVLKREEEVEEQTRKVDIVRERGEDGQDASGTVPQESATAEKKASKLDDEGVCVGEDLEEARKSEDGRIEGSNTVQPELERLREENSTMRKELDDKRATLETLEGKLFRRGLELKQLRNELAHARVEQSQTDELLHSRTLELQGAEIFLTKADSLSGAEVIEMVSKLNAEIFQAAAHMADSFPFDRQAGTVTPEIELKSIREWASSKFGEALVHSLETTKHDEDPFLIQIAFQAAIALCSQILSHSWYLYDPKMSQFLSQIYENAQKTELQSIAGRWRSLTRAHIRTMQSGLDVLSSTTPFIVHHLVAVLLVAGYRDTHARLVEIFRSKFGENLRRIADMALYLNKEIGEGITTGDLQMLYLPCGMPFNPDHMEDGDGGGIAGARVLCTTDLGLRRVEKSSAGGRHDWEETMLLKPKVALDSLVQIAG